MSNPILYVPAANCAKSPSNVRKRSDATADAQLEANIEAKGVIQNLIGVPVARKKGHYRITGGGRRLDRVHNLIARGVFPADYLVPVMVMKSAGDAIETSLSENFFKLTMNPADACRAFQDIIDIEKKTPADVAKRFGLTERFVLGRLRLATLAEPIFDALRDEVITIEVATAYASTSDTDRQAAVFAQMGGAYYRNNVGEIRRLLASGSYKGGDPKALLVGRDAYMAEGGRIDSDLFSDGASEIWLDGDLLDRLAQARLEEAAATLRERDGFAEVRTVQASHIPFSETYRLTRLVGTPVPLSETAQARKAEIEAELAAIEADAEQAEEYTEDQTGRIEALEEELGTVVDTGAVITDEQRAGAIAYMVIGADGQPRLHEEYFVASQPETEPAEGADEAERTGEEASDADENDAGPKYSQRLTDELAMMKTELIAVHIASDPHFALDLAIFLMVDSATRKFGSYDVPSEIKAQAPTARVPAFDSGTPAAERWATLSALVDRSWCAHGEVAARYDAFCALDDAARAAWLAWVVAQSLQAASPGSRGDQFLDHLACKLAIDAAAWWRPTARTFFDRISKPAILSLFEKVGGAELRSRYAASRKFDLAASAEKLFSGQIIVEADVKERALAWLPPMMIFDKKGLEPSDESIGGESLAGTRDGAGDATEPRQDEAPLSEAA